MNLSSLMKTSLRVLGVILGTLVFQAGALGQRIDGTNIAYQEGDWISYSESRFIRSIQITQDMVYAASEGGILRFDTLTREWLFPFTKSNGLPENDVLAVAYDIATNQLWCSTPSAIGVYDATARTWRNEYLDMLGMNTSDPILSIGFSNPGVWLESQFGRTYFSYGSISSFSLANPTGNGSVEWYGRRGFKHFELQQFILPNSMLFIDSASDYYVQDNNLRSFRINYYVADQWQSLWAGTAGLGLFSADLRTGEMIHRPFGLLSRDVRTIYKDGPNLWLGGVHENDEMDGVTVWNTATDQWNYFEPRLITRFGGGEVRAISTAGDALWFGTNDGLVRYDTEKERWKTFTVFDNLLDNRIYSLAGENAILWVGTHDGLDRLDGVENSDSVDVHHISEWRDQVAVYDILIDETTVWAGTSAGLFFYDRIGNDHGFYRGVDGPGSDTVTALAKLGDSLFVSTFRSIEIYDIGRKEWLGPPARRDFDHTYINDINASQGIVWVGADDGLYKYNLKDNYWKHFTVEDGLLDSGISKIELDGDYLLLGSPQGLTRFYWNSRYRMD